MVKFITAVATDDGKTFMDRHFGDAGFYNVYEISSTEAKFIKKINNTTEDDDGHGDPHKAKGVTGMLKKEGVNMAVSKVFGPNLKRIKKKFLCVLFKEGNIEDSIKKLQENFPDLAVEWAKGEERSFIRL